MPHCWKIATLTLVTSVGLAGATPGDELFVISPSPAIESNAFGDSLGLHGDLGVVGAAGVWTQQIGGHAYVIDVVTGVIRSELPLVSTDPDRLWVFGAGIGEGIALVGYQDEALSTYRNGVQRFDISDPDNPVYIDTLKPSDAVFTDSFGDAIAVDGNIAIIGVSGDDDNGGLSGSAYLFDISTGAELSKLLPTDGGAVQQFGFSVDIQGTTAIVGARWDDDLGTRSGSAYLFDISDPANPVQTAKLTASDGQEQDFFGFDVAVSGDLALVGAIFEDERGFDAGAVYLYDITDRTNPVESRKITPADANDTDDFGWTVALDADTALIGSRTDDDLFPGGGSAYLFDVSDPNNPIEVVKMTPADTSANATFGWSGDLDGGRALIGASQSDVPAINAGQVYVFDAQLEPSGCSAADLAEPFGTLNFFDIAAFIGLFNSGDPAADVAAPFGSLNFFDVAGYIGIYNSGCP